MSLSTNQQTPSGLPGIFLDLFKMLIVELRQYGIAAIVMLICMGALGWVFTTFESVRKEKDSEIRDLNEKVFTAFTENTKAVDRGAEAQEKTVKAIEDLRGEIRRNQ